MVMPAWPPMTGTSTVETSRVTGGWTWDSNGMMVMPAWPPITGTSTVETSRPLFSATKVFERTTSRVVTPKILLVGLPAFLYISQAMGTVELTGFEMMQMKASGQTFAQALVSWATMLALVLNKSSRVMPGFLGTPAGITTTLQSFKHSSSSSGPVCPVTWALESMWLRSQATPGVWATSYRASLVTLGFCLRRREVGWPMPPEAPRTATLWLLTMEVDRVLAPMVGGTLLTLVSKFLTAAMILFLSLLQQKL